MPPSLAPLPPHLAERVRSHAGLTPASDARFMLYWARTALRAHENPALDVALEHGRSLGLPVFVYHALSERYPHASDRHHHFILEGARDFAQALAARGIGTAFHLERPGHRGRCLEALARQSALVVTELMPVAPLRKWTDALADTIPVPLLEVDTACVVPVTLTSQAYERAFEYRAVTVALRRARVAAGWPEATVDAAPFIPDLPFTPIPLATADFAALVAECDIDHAVGPIPETRGGSAAGYHRWNAFLARGGLDSYARVRNDPVHRDGVSRMSAYLHYGMVSPLRLAREAAARTGDGAAKWLDELMVWRELAYTFCHHRPEHATVAAVPAWARDTLRAHEPDPRPHLDDERLARGRTPDPFWNEMQRSLLAHGELHNNVRMTWGKAIVGWTPDAERALHVLVSLNHRYALDGRDPASYGGLLWCLGQFDRPFTPERPVLGTVRDRGTTGQARRIDVAAYTAGVLRAGYGEGLRVAVVGAGAAGLMCARTLADHNVRVTVFDKSRGVGGRCATRREGAWRFDHGARYFTVRDPRIAVLVHAWHAQGVVAPWAGRIVSRDAGHLSDTAASHCRWVGTPGMSAVCRHLAADLDVRLGTTVAPIERGDGAWRLASTAGESLGEYDIVLVTAPSPQAASLLALAAPAMSDRAAGVAMHPTWATMLVVAERLPLEWEGAFVNDDVVLSWVARDAGKPARGDAGESWVLHATREWSAAHLDADPATVAQAMTAAFETVAGCRVTPAYSVAHRWRYATPDPVLVERALYDGARGIGAGGDWCGGPRVEGAMLSGIALAGRVLSHAHAAGGAIRTPGQ